MGGVQDPRAYVGGGGLGLKGGQVCSYGCLSQCLQRLKLVGWEGGCNGGPTLAHHSTMMPSFYGVPGFFLKLSHLWSS